MYNKDGSTIKQDDLVYVRTGGWKGYDIQVVDIQPGDTILFHINDDVDIESFSLVVRHLLLRQKKYSILASPEYMIDTSSIVHYPYPVAMQVKKVV